MKIMKSKVKSIAVIILLFSTFIPMVSGWSGSWSDGWTISETNDHNSTGYEYGNWSISEHVRDGTLDEDSWVNASNNWSVVDDSSWWFGNYTYTVNMTNVNHTFSVLNNSGMNRSQGFGWVHFNDTEVDLLFPYIIFAYNNASDFDVVMWSSVEVWTLHWNGTNMSDVSTGVPIEHPSGNATDISGQWSGEGVYLNDEGNYYKYIYNELNGTIKFKWWGNGIMAEPPGWTVDYTHTNLTYTANLSHGIGAWNPYGRDTVMQWDLMNIWQLNYTTNASSWCNISGYNESRPHMEYPVIDLGTWTEEVMTYFNDTYVGNMSADAVCNMMKDNMTNPMNLESRMFELANPDAYQQNDTVYYYSCLIDNFTFFDPDSDYDEFLHLHVQMCPEYEINTGEYADFVVAIDVDNNHIWDVNDRMYWAYGNDTYVVTKLAYNGNGDPTTVIYGAQIWQTDTSSVGNLHRYNKHLNYAMNIPLADLIKDSGEPLNVSDVFGLSIITTTADAVFLGDPCVWQNWNETTDQPFWTEQGNTLMDATDYFNNGTGEEHLPNATSIGRWGEGVITDAGDIYNESGTINYNMSIEAAFNDTSADAGEVYAHVNTSIWINNTGAGNLSGIYVNVSWWNCSCNDLDMEFIDSNQDISNWTWYNDSCYAVIHNVSNEPLTAGSSWHIWYNVNITNCTGISHAIETLNITGNATEMTSDTTHEDAATFTWGVTLIRLCIGYRTDMVDVEDVGNSVFNIVGVLMVIGAILIIIGMVSKYYR